MKSNKDVTEMPFSNSSEETITYAIERASILDEMSGAIIREPGIFLVTGIRETGREAFLEDLKQKLILTGCAVFSASRAFSSFSDFVYHCLQQQRHGDHSRMDMLPLQSDGANLFFDGNQLTVFILDQVDLLSNQVLQSIIQTMITANNEGHQVAVVLADEILINDRLEALKFQDAIVASNIIPVLDASVVRDYIDDTLSLNNTEYADCVFSPGSIREIVTLARGDLNQVNELCKESLKLAMKSEDQIVTVHMVKESGSDRFFKVQDEDNISEPVTNTHRPKRPVRKAGWMGLFFNKLQVNAFAMTAALIPLILVAGYIKSSIDEKERAETLAQKAKSNNVVISQVSKEANTHTPEVDASLNSPRDTNDSGLLVNVTEPALNEKNSKSSLEQQEPVDTTVVASALNQVSENESSNSPVIAGNDLIESVTSIEPAISRPLTVIPEIVGNEDSEILLQVGIGAGHSINDKYMEISGVPDGAALSKGNRHGDIWTVSADQVPGLELIPSVNKDHDYNLGIKLKDTSKHSVIADNSIRVKVQAVADKPFMSFSGATGDQFTAIPIEINARLADTDGSESLTIEVVGLPDTVKISAGQKNDAGIWVLSPKDLDGLILTPMEGSPKNLNLLIMAVASEAENGSRAVVSGTLNISIIPSKL